MELGLSVLSLLSGDGQFLPAVLGSGLLGSDYGSPGRDDGGDSRTGCCNESAVTIRHI